MFSNLFEAAKNIGSNIISSAKSVFGAAFNEPIYPGSQTTPRSLTANIGQAIKPVIEPIRRQFIASSPVIRPEGVNILESRGSVSVPVPISQYNIQTGGINYGGVRPSTAHLTPTPAPAPTSAPTPAPSPDVFSRSVPLTQAPSGQAGISAPSYQPLTAPGGLPGTPSGGSSFRGVLGGTSGLALPGTTTEEEQRRIEAQKRGIIIDPVTGNQYVKGAQGTYERYNPIPSPSIPPFRASTPTSPVDISNFQAIQGTVNQIQKSLSSGGALSPQTIAQFTETLNKAYSDSVALQQRMNPIPLVPIVDTQEQVSFLQNQPQESQLTLRQQMDDLRGKIGLPALETQKISLIQQMNGLNDAFESIYKDIKENPELPKGLALRRIQEAEKIKGVQLKNVVGQLEIINQQVNDANGRLNQEFQIIQTEEQIRSRRIDDARQNVSLYISSGALGYLSDTDLRRLSVSSGFALSGLRAAQSAMLDKKDKYQSFTTKEDAAGNVTVLGITSKGGVDVLRTIKGIGTPSAAVSGGGLTSTQQIKYNQDLADSIADLAKQPNRDSALKTISQYQTAITTRFGQAGLEKMKQEVERLFPAKVALTQQNFSINQAVSGFIKKLFSPF